MPTKEKNILDSKDRVVMERLASIEEQGERSFDIEFWQRLSDEQRLNAVWEMVVMDWELKGKDKDALRLQRTVENLQPQQS
jgi:hypothetical protein